MVALLRKSTAGHIFFRYYGPSYYYALGSDLSISIINSLHGLPFGDGTEKARGIQALLRSVEGSSLATLSPGFARFIGVSGINTHSQIFLLLHIHRCLAGLRDLIKECHPQNIVLYSLTV